MGKALLALLLLSLPCAAQTLVHSNSVDCANTNPCTLTITSTTAGNALFLVGFVQSSGSASHTSASGCGTWSTAISFTAYDGNREIFILFAPNISGSCTSISITFPATSGAAAADVEYSGMPTSGLFDVASSAMSTGTGTCTSTAITPTSSQAELFIGVLFEKTNQSQTWTGTNSWVVEKNQGNATDGDTVALADKTIASTSGTYTVSGTVTPGTNSACAFATFKASSGAAAKTCTLSTMGAGPC